MGSELPLENIITEKLTSLGHNPSLKKTLLGAGIGAGTIGLPAAYIGADEGMGLDVMVDDYERRMQEAKRTQMLQELMERY